MIRFQLNPDKSFIDVMHQGEIDLNQILQFMEDVEKEFHDQKELRILLDYTGSQLKFHLDLIALDFEEIKEFILSRISKYDRILTASYPGSGDNVVITEFYRRFAADISNYNYQTFNSREACIEWLRSE